MRALRTSLSMAVMVACATAACSDAAAPTAALGPHAALARAASANAGRPAPSESELVTDDLCPGIHLELQLSGAAKTLTVGKSGGITIFLSPRMEATLTNLADPSKTVTLSITGAFHQTVSANGDVVTVMTGRNLAYDPMAEPHFALVEGRFSFVFDAAGNLVQPRAGEGRVTDVCALVA